MAVQMHRLTKFRLIDERQHNDAAALDREQRRPFVRRQRRVRSGGERQVLAKCTAQIEAVRQRIGRQRLGIEQGRGTKSFGSIDEVSEGRFRAGNIEHDRRLRAGLTCRIKKQIDPVARAENYPAIAGEEGLRRLAVDRQHPGGMTIESERERPRPGGIGEAQAKPLVGPDGEVKGWYSIDGRMRRSVTVRRNVDRAVRR